MAERRGEGVHGTCQGVVHGQEEGAVGRLSLPNTNEHRHIIHPPTTLPLSRRGHASHDLSTTGPIPLPSFFHGPLTVPLMLHSINPLLRYHPFNVRRSICISLSYPSSHPCCIFAACASVHCWSLGSFTHAYVLNHLSRPPIHLNLLLFSCSPRYDLIFMVMLVCALNPPTLLPHPYSLRHPLFITKSPFQGVYESTFSCCPKL